MEIASPVLFGRDREVRWLEDAVTAVTIGQGGAVMLEGETGIGKTTLLRRAIELASQAGLRVHSGTAGELEQQVPFAAIGRCLDTAAGRSDAVLAGVGHILTGWVTSQPADGMLPQFVIAEDITKLICRWCEQGPMLLAMDDLQWADSASLLVLHRLLRALTGLPLLVVCAAGDPLRNGRFEQFQRNASERIPRQIKLAPLTDEAAAGLAARVAGAPADPRLLRLAAGAAGNPLYITELIAGLAAERRIEVSNGIAYLQSADAALPVSLSAVIRRRTSILPSASRELLSTAAVLGLNFTIAELSAVSDLSFPQLMRAVRRVVRNGLLTSAGDRLEFRHDLVRRALDEDVPAPVRSAIHLQVARNLGSTGAPVEQVAEHIILGNSLDPALTEWLTRSVDSLIAQAPGLASDLLGLALKLNLPQGGERRLEVDLALALLCSDRLAEAEHVARGALADARDVAHEGRLRWLLAQAHFRQGRLDAAAMAAEKAVGLPGLEASLEARLHSFMAMCYGYSGRLDPARAAIARAGAAASADPMTTAYRLSAVSGLEFTQQRMAEALAHSTRGLCLLAEVDVPADLQFAPHLTHGMILLESDRLDDSDKVFDTGLRFDERFNGTFIPSLHTARALVRFWAGRWDDCLVEVKAAAQATDPLGLAQAAHGIAALIAVHRREQPDHLDQPAAAGLGGQFFDFLRRWTMALSGENGGECDDALRTLLDAWEHCAPAIVPMRYRMAADIARIADTVGDNYAARRISREVASLAARRRTPGVHATALLCQGLLDRRADLLESAAAIYREVGYPLFEAYAKENAAVVLARIQRPHEARAALSAALSIYNGLTADRDSVRAMARLRRDGVRYTAYAPRRRAKSGWDALTETERRVAELVAAGLSNPEIGLRLFVSRRTVQCHVSSILAKLSLKSRIELAVEYAQHRPAAAS